MRFVNGATVHGYVGQTSDTYSSPATVVNELLIAVPAVRGNDPAPTRAQRWHRFLPGMYR